MTSVTPQSDQLKPGLQSPLRPAESLTVTVPFEGVALETQALVGAVSMASEPLVGNIAAPANRSASLPAWCPAWAERLGDAYLSGTSCLFLLHGNVRDLVATGPPAVSVEAPSGNRGTVPDFLGRELFGRWDIVLAYDVGKGLRPLAGSDPNRLRTVAHRTTGRGCSLAA